MWATYDILGVCIHVVWQNTTQCVNLHILQVLLMLYRMDLHGHEVIIQFYLLSTCISLDPDTVFRLLFQHSSFLLGAY